MRNSRVFSICAVAAAIVLCLGLAVTASAAGKEDNAAEAFAKLKTLAGNWEATSDHGKQGKLTTSYEVISKGSALVEHIHMPGEDDMVTVYHLDGDKLVMTHYCTAGNQPHMQAASYDPSSNQLLFDFTGGGNLSNPNVGHMHNVAFKFTSADEFSAKWTFQENGKTKFAENIEYRRVK